MELPAKKYNIVYADPPWRFKYRHGENDLSGHNEGIYHLMNIDEIKKLPVDTIADKNCVLFLWITDPFLREGMDVMDSWGFTYKTVAFTWVKTNVSNNGYWLGMGYWTRSNPEMCLLGTKGSPKRIDSNVHQLVISHRREHSRKPDEVRNRIVSLCGDVSRIELFARNRFSGWDVWGDEVENTIQNHLVEG